MSNLFCRFLFHGNGEKWAVFQKTQGLALDGKRCLLRTLRLMGSTVAWGLALGLEQGAWRVPASRPSRAQPIDMGLHLPRGEALGIGPRLGWMGEELDLSLWLDGRVTPLNMGLCLSWIGVQKVTFDSLRSIGYLNANSWSILTEWQWWGICSSIGECFGRHQLSRLNDLLDPFYAEC